MIVDHGITVMGEVIMKEIHPTPSHEVGPIDPQPCSP